MPKVEITIIGAIFVLSSSFVAIILSDISHRRIPNWATLAILGVSTLLAAHLGPDHLLTCLVTGGCLLGLAYGLAVVGAARAGRPVLGMGDVKLLGACGVLVGAQQAPVLVLLSSGLAMAYGLAGLWGSRRRGIPFGPAIVAAALLLWIPQVFPVPLVAAFP